MGFTNYISEAEAIHVCGVSAKTLSRFAEAGYLSVEKEADGLRLYSSSELEKVFGTLKTKARPKQHTAKVSSSTSSKVVSFTSSKKSAEQNGKKTASPQPKQETEPRKPVATKADTPRQQESASTPEPQRRVESQEESYYSSTSTPPQQRVYAQEGSINTASNLATKSVAASSVATVLEEQRAPQVEKADPHQNSLLEAQIDKLERINEVNEKIIELREERISELTAERDWLRNRVEKLEEKAERDQILLLSETQILRTMIEQQRLPRSPVRAALEWLGVVEAKQPEFPSDKKVIDSQG